MKPASFEKREWIDPWGDRCPMTDDTVLVTYWNRWEKKPRMELSSYVKNEEQQGWDTMNVLAWQPLPEAYDPVAEAE